MSNPKMNPLTDLVTLFLAVGFDVFATPAMFLVSYNYVAPAMFGLVRIYYWQSFVLVWAVRLLIWKPAAALVTDRHEVDRIRAAVRSDESGGLGQMG